jgi:hypothetical protein
MAYWDHCGLNSDLNIIGMEPQLPGRMADVAMYAHFRVRKFSGD